MSMGRLAELCRPETLSGRCAGLGPHFSVSCTWRLGTTATSTSTAATTNYDDYDDDDYHYDYDEYCDYCDY